MLYFAIKKSVTFPRMTRLLYQFCLKRCYNSGYCTFHSKVITFRVYITFCVNFKSNGVTNFSFVSRWRTYRCERVWLSCAQTFSLFFFDKFNKRGERSIFSLPHPDHLLQTIGDKMSWDTSPKTGLFYVLLTSKGGNIAFLPHPLRAMLCPCSSYL